MAEGTPEDVAKVKEMAGHILGVYEGGGGEAGCRKRGQVEWGEEEAE